MPTLEQITETGIFSLGAGGFHREFVPFNEELTAESFADEINSGRLSVRDAYVNFWSYEEDAELWDLPKDQEWRALLPAWKNVLLDITKMLDDSKIIDLADVISKSYFDTTSFFKLHEYNPFFKELTFAAEILGEDDSENKESSRIVATLVDLLDKTKVSVMRPMSKRNENIYRLFDSDYLISLFQSIALSRTIKGFNALKGYLEYSGEAGIKLNILYSFGMAGISDAVLPMASLLRERWWRAQAEGTEFEIIRTRKIFAHEHYQANPLESILMIGKEKAGKVLLEELPNVDRELRIQLIYLIGAIGYGEAGPDLMHYLNDKDDEIKATVIGALGKIAYQESLSEICKLVGHTNSDIRANCAYAVGRIGKRETVTYLEKLLRDGKGEVRGKAIEAVGNGGFSELGDQIFGIAVQKKRWERFTAFEALVRLGSEEYIQGLFENEDEDVRASVADFFRNSFLVDQVTQIEYAPYLMRLVEDPSGEVRFYAYKALTNMRYGDAKQKVSELLFDSHPWVREAAMKAAGIFDCRESIEYLTNVFFDKKEEMLRRAYAGRSLCQMEQKNPFFELAEKDKEDFVDVLESISSGYPFTNEEDRMLQQLGPQLLDIFRGAPLDKKRILIKALGRSCYTPAIVDLIDVLDYSDLTYAQSWMKSDALYALNNLGAILPFNKIVDVVLEENGFIETSYICQMLEKGGTIDYAHRFRTITPENLDLNRLSDCPYLRFKSLLDRIHQRLKPQGYNPAVKRLAA